MSYWAILFIFINSIKNFKYFYFVTYNLVYDINGHLFSYTKSLYVILYYKASYIAFHLLCSELQPQEHSPFHIATYIKFGQQAKSVNKFSSDDMKGANSVMGAGFFTDNVFNLDER